MKKTFFPFIIILTIFPFAGIAQLTKINVQKGQKFLVETSTKITNAAEVMGQTMENTIDSKTSTIYEIKNTGADSSDLQTMITKMVVAATMMGQELNFNSDKKDNEGPMADMLSKTINKAKVVTINAKGTITKQDEDDNPAGPGGLSGLIISNMTTTELFIPALIGKELKQGDSITDIVTSNKEKFSNRDSGTYKITAVENGVASISYVGTQFTNAVMEQMGMEMTSTSNNKVMTEMQVDIMTGLVLMKASVTDTATSIEAGGMTIPATGKTITTVKITTVL